MTKCQMWNADCDQCWEPFENFAEYADEASLNIKLTEAGWIVDDKHDLVFCSKEHEKEYWGEGYDAD